MKSCSRLVDSSGHGRVASRTGVFSAISSSAQPSSVEHKSRVQPPLSIGANPLMAYVPGGAAYTATDVKPAAAPVKRAVKKGKAGGSCCC